MYVVRFPDLHSWQSGNLTRIHANWFSLERQEQESGKISSKKLELELHVWRQGTGSRRRQ